MAIPNKTAIEKIKDDYAANSQQAPPTPPTIEEENKEVTEIVSQSTIDKFGDDEFLKEAERRGLRVSKEVLSQEQQKLADEIEETEKLRFALENKLITQDGYLEAKAVLNSEGADLTKKEFSKSFKTENPTATKEEVESAYNDYYFVQQNIKVVTKNDDDEEVEIEKPKWDDRFVKWGDQRQKAKAERIKEGAKSTLDTIDKSYSNYKTLVNKANDYSKNVDKVIAETNFAEYPTNHKVKNRDITAVVKFPKPDEVKADVKKYLSESLGNLMIQADKHNDVPEIKKQIHGYLRERYASDFEDTLWDLAETSGINKGKVGASAPPERTLMHDDTVVSALEKEAQSRLPNNPLLKKKR